MEIEGNEATSDLSSEESLNNTMREVQEQLGLSASSEEIAFVISEPHEVLPLEAENCSPGSTTETAIESELVNENIVSN
jgi:hypothetical protein